MRKKLLLLCCIFLSLTFLPMTAFGASSTGQSGAEVREIQWILRQFGYFDGSVTGYYGSVTASAVKEFQSDMGLSATGKCDDQTLNSLRLASKSVGSVKASSLNVRTAPSGSASVATTVSAGNTVYVYSYDGSWAHIKTSNGTWGYVSSSYIEVGSVNGISATVSAGDSLNIRSGAGTGYRVLKSAPAGAALTIVGGSGSWFKVVYSGTTGYASKSYVRIAGGSSAAATASATSPEASSWNGYVTASSLRVRTGAGTGNSVITSLKKGAAVTVLATSGEWYHVQLSSGTKGYVSKSYISASTSSSAAVNGKITGISSSLNVRKGAGTNYGVVARLSNGTTVTVLSVNGSWTQIRVSSGVEGYVSSRYVSTSATVAETTLTAPSGTYKMGSQSSGVVSIQQKLKELGFFTAGATGYYGTITVAAVKSFQRANGLTVDGICGSKTIAAMFSSSASSAGSSASSGSGSTSAASDIGEQIVAYAKQFLGKPYVYGANGPNSFDCTGLTCYVYKHFGYTLPRTAYAQGYTNYGTKITSASALKPGDLVFFNTVSDSDLSDHAGIYIGNNQVIHAASGSSSGRKVVISDMTSTYYRTRFSWGRRVF